MLMRSMSCNKSIDILSHVIVSLFFYNLNDDPYIAKLKSREENKILSYCNVLKFLQLILQPCPLNKENERFQNERSSIIKALKLHLDSVINHHHDHLRVIIFLPLSPWGASCMYGLKMTKRIKKKCGPHISDKVGDVLSTSLKTIRKYNLENVSSRMHLMTKEHYEIIE